MPMREGCKHFQSRSYDTGEVVRFCELDLAPEAPWRCPDDCASYAPPPGRRRLAATGAWSSRAIEDEPGPGGPDVVRLLEEAADIVDAVVPETLAEVREERAPEARGRRWWRRRWPWQAATRDAGPVVEPVSVP